ncbi:DNA-binding NtrC family response regulator [Lysinibacillus parviboronicapiens]|uniref:DNA-binding NtrC family response regulator n=1 Tax=Lysinibacillus parviboronicapiens TaxID=436516 RepID=A0ABV2PHS7_9BACI
MKWITKVACVLCLSTLLVGCSERLTEIKDAASGITSAADSAANAVSRDVHAIRAIAIDYNDKSFTINDLFKTILRDVRWDYDAKQNELQVQGTWQPPLFSEQGWNQDKQKQLAETGLVTVTCVIDGDKIDSTLTDLKLVFNNEIMYQINGEEALHYLYDTYLQK